MLRSRRAWTWLLVAGLVSSAGCAAHARPRPGVVYVVRKPPPARIEIIVATPGVGYVWVPGFWAWQRQDFVWISGQWMIPPHGFRRYEPGRWLHQRHGWYYREGRWR